MDTLLEEIANHLEFFGYAIEKIEREDAPNKFIYYASHERYCNLRFLEVYKNFLCFQLGHWHDEHSTNTSALAEVFNKFNRKSTLAKFYFTSDEDGSRILVYTEAVFIGEYEKQSFALFHDRFQAEARDAFETDLYKNCIITRQEQNCVVQ